MSREANDGYIQRLAKGIVCFGGTALMRGWRKKGDGGSCDGGLCRTVVCEVLEGKESRVRWMKVRENVERLIECMVWFQ